MRLCEIMSRTMKGLIVVGIIAVPALFVVLHNPPPSGPILERRGVPMGERVEKTDAEWQAVLSPEQYRVTRRKGPEPAFAGAYWKAKQEGMYRCICCGQPLFDSGTKFDPGTGWPSFWQPVEENSV